ncbi:KilA-N domain-containing protein [Shewanella algae]
MYDLNDIHRAFKLPKIKLPNQWRHRIRDRLTQTAKLRAGRTAAANGHLSHHTWATQEALYAYAMWCDVEFYMVVVDAFTALTNGDIEEAQGIAQTVVSVHEQRATELYLQGHH